MSSGIRGSDDGNVVDLTGSQNMQLPASTRRIYSPPGSGSWELAFPKPK